MTMLVKTTLVIAFLVSIIIPFGIFLMGEQNKRRYKATIASNAIMFFGTLALAVIMMSASPVMAAEAANTGYTIGDGLAFIGAALATGLSGIGGGIAVASAASAALGALSEDSSILGKSLIFVGLAEGVALYGLIISFMILSKL